MLRQGNENQISAKFVEMENKVFEAERNKNSLSAQLTQEKQRLKSLQSDFDQMVEQMKAVESGQKTSN